MSSLDNFIHEPRIVPKVRVEDIQALVTKHHPAADFEIIPVRNDV
jgi:hypothetical protein